MTLKNLNHKLLPTMEDFTMERIAKVSMMI